MIGNTIKKRDVRYCEYCGGELNMESGYCVKCGKKADLPYEISKKLSRLEEQSKKQSEELRWTESGLKELSTIKKWVTFLGVITIISLVLDALVVFLGACTACR